MPFQKYRAALIVEITEEDGSIKKLIYGFDPNRELTINLAPDYDANFNIFHGPTHYQSYETKLTIEGWAGDPTAYDGPMPQARQKELEHTKALTDGTPEEEIIYDEDWEED